MRHLGILITFFLLCVKTFPSDPPGQGGDYDDVSILSKYALLASSNFLTKNEEYGRLFRLINNTGTFTAGLNVLTLNPQNHNFDNALTIESYDPSTEDYPPHVDLWSFIYLYVALIGFYIAIIIQFNKKIDRIAKILISCFIFIHSIFILHIYLNMTNYQFQFPHSFRMSTAFSFLYGPLLYFYFKRITQQYVFKKIDLLHLIPTIVLIIVLAPSYILIGEEKLIAMIRRSVESRSALDLSIIIIKLLSLIIYGYFIRSVYLKSKKSKGLSKQNMSWQKNIYFIHIAYIGCYAAYGLLLGNDITSGYLFQFQIIFMALMVMYIGYSANVQPSVFSGSLIFEDRLFFKYEKSGLTKSLSQELKKSLIDLMEIEKIYKENDINLEILANKLNTSRHNASQVINEHFDLNFHEFINKYRINEAKNIFNLDFQKNLNIIDVAYEVGFNNKVTFNKAFKKDTNLTPSEYQRIIVKASV